MSTVLSECEPVTRTVVLASVGRATEIVVLVSNGSPGQTTLGIVGYGFRQKLGVVQLLEIVGVQTPT